MKVEVFTIGKPRLRFVREGVDEYTKRLRRYAKISLVAVGDESAMLRQSQGAFRIVLDERGDLPTTEAFAQRYRSWMNDGKKRVAFLIGGAEGHSDAIFSRADWVLALSRFTLQHELALLVLFEQLYRVQTLLAGHPYHRPSR